MASRLETVAAIYEAFGKGDVPSILEKLSEDVRWEEWPDNFAQKAGIPWLQERRGREGAAAFFQSLAGLKIHGFELRTLMEGGDHVAADFAIDAEVVATGTRFREEEIHLWTFDDSGKVVRFRHYLDTAKQIAATGV